VITDLGVLSPHPDTRELQLTAMYEGVTIERVRQATGWPLLVADDVASLPPPTETELEVLRDLQERTRLAHAG
jgi:glutaconate CoA-transferase subunit B